MAAWLAATRVLAWPAAVAPLRRSPWLFGGLAPATSKASRKKKRKGHSRHIKSPPRFSRQKDGDFPIMVRSSHLPEVRDLQDSALDADADFDRIPKVKPHKVRDAVRQQEGAPPQGTMGDKMKVSALQNHHVGASSEIPRFDLEKDLKEEDAAELAAIKARERAQRNYKWMPNPYGAKPGPLGTSPRAEARYYQMYFDGKQAQEDHRNLAGGQGEGEEFRDPRLPKPRRERISPRKFWYKTDYVSPDPPSVVLMRSRELKFAMANEAHLVRKWRLEQPEGRAAGLPPNTHDLWMAFGYRAGELSTGRPMDFRPPEPGDSDGAKSAATAASAANSPPSQRKIQDACSLVTTLRFLQDMASVQAGPYSALQLMILRMLDNIKDLKPDQCYTLLQCMSRLRLRHPKAAVVLERMGVAWMMLRPIKFVRAANAVAKLDLGNHLWAKPLKVALFRMLPRLSGPHLSRLKSIAVMELLDDPEAMQSYLEQCERTRASHIYPRHLQVTELHAHLVYPDLWTQLDEGLRLFLQEVRTAGEQSRAENGYGPGAGRTSARRSANRRQQLDRDWSSNAEDGDTDSDEGTDCAGATVPVVRGGFDKHRFSSALHQDMSRVLRDILDVEHQNLLAAGPMTVDMCHLPTMTVLEARAQWQYYQRSSRLTALARRRQEMLRAMGFRLVPVSYHRWEMLRDDTQKAAFLRDRLPSDIFTHRPKDTLGGAHETGREGMDERAQI